MVLFDSKKLERAIKVQRRCYQFLQLIKNDQLNLTGQWSFGGFHENSTNEVERTKEIITAHFMNIPENARPVSTDKLDLNEFANFFISYLFCSFDFIESEKRLVQESESGGAGQCWCELCARMTKAPNLKLKKVTRWDKDIADNLEEESLRGLVLKKKLNISEEKVYKILQDKNFTKERALIAYGLEIIRRCNGEESDASSLVLWRRFAWENGSPIKGFILDVETILGAGKKLSFVIEGVG